MQSYLIAILPDRKCENIRIKSDKTDARIEYIDFQDKNSDLMPVDVNYHRERYEFDLSNSEIRNFMAHRRAWKQFLATKASWCLILENNVMLNVEQSVIDAVIDELPDDWDVFFPYDHQEYTEKINSPNPAATLLNPNLKEMNSWEPYVMGYRWGNSIYFISRAGAEKLLDIHTIRQRLDDEILTLADSEKLTIYAAEVDWFNYSQVKQIIFADRNLLIWRAICNNSTWTLLRKNRVRYLLKVISEVAEELKIDLILQGGSHLGYVRHGGIMPWDDDVDIGIEEYKLQDYLHRLSTVDGICYDEVMEPCSGVPYYKIWSIDGEMIENCHYTFPFVDLWLYNRHGNDLVFKNGIICLGSAAQAFVEVVFEDAKFKIPCNSIEVLDTRYIDWRQKIRVYVWSHCYEKHHFSPFILDIEVDAAGRLVSQLG